MTAAAPGLFLLPVWPTRLSLPILSSQRARRLPPAAAASLQRRRRGGLWRHEAVDDEDGPRISRRRMVDGVLQHGGALLQDGPRISRQHMVDAMLERLHTFPLGRNGVLVVEASIAHEAELELDAPLTRKRHQEG